MVRDNVKLRGGTVQYVLFGWLRREAQYKKVKSDEFVNLLGRRGLDIFFALRIIVDEIPRMFCLLQDLQVVG